MNLLEARMILGEAVQGDGGLSRLGEGYIDYKQGDNVIELDGTFTASEIEALHVWLSHKVTGVIHDECIYESAMRVINADHVSLDGPRRIGIDPALGAPFTVMSQPVSEMTDEQKAARYSPTLHITVRHDLFMPADGASPARCSCGKVWPCPDAFGGFVSNPHS